MVLTFAVRIVPHLPLITLFHKRLNRLTSQSGRFKIYRTFIPSISILSRTMTTSIPSTTKGVQIAKTGGTEVLDYKTDIPVPQPKEGEVLVKSDYAGVNYIDT
jgi:hypothetical protein